MAATPWAVYNRAKKAIGNGTIQLGVSPLKIKLCGSGSNAGTQLSTYASVTDEVTGGGYTAGGKALTGVTWTAGASAGQIRLDADDIVFSVAGSDLTGIKYAVIGLSGGPVLCWSQLSAAAFSVTDGNTLTIQINAAGIFNLT